MKVLLNLFVFPWLLFATKFIICQSKQDPLGPRQTGGIPGGCAELALCLSHVQSQNDRQTQTEHALKHSEQPECGFDGAAVKPDSL